MRNSPAFEVGHRPVSNSPFSIASAFFRSSGRRLMPTDFDTESTQIWAIALSFKIRGVCSVAVREGGFGIRLDFGGKRHRAVLSRLRTFTDESVVVNFGDPPQNREARIPETES